MKNLPLYSTGKDDFLKSLKEKYDKLIFDLKNNQELSPAEREATLKELNKKYKSEKSNAEYGLFSLK
jgi:hypothetical protein